MTDDALTADDRQLLTEIAETYELDQLAMRVFAYYHDNDRADRTSRSQMYLHLGMLSGALLRALDGRARSRFLVRREQPPAVDASDPHVASTGKLTTRDVNSSSSSSSSES